jgi:hypothetical protein
MAAEWEWMTDSILDEHICGRRRAELLCITGEYFNVIKSICHDRTCTKHFFGVDVLL